MWQIFIGFLPWILFSAFYGKSRQEIVLTLIISSIVLLVSEWRQLLKGFILSWGTLLFFFLVYVFTLLFRIDWVVQNAWMLSNAFLALIVWFSLFVGKPFTIQYAYEQTPKQIWNTPGFWHVNKRLTVMWGLILTFSAVLYLIPWGVTTAQEIIYQVLLYAPMTLGFYLSKKYPSWYRERQIKKRLQANPCLQNNFAPIREESDFENLIVKGEIPKHLQGAYMRNGSNPAFDPISYTYPIDGDGMIHAMYLEDKLHYRNRYVKTKGLLLEQKLGRAIYGGIAMPIPPDPKLIGPNDDPGPFKNGAFIHIIKHAQRYLAMWEGGPAYEVDHELNTIEEWHPGTTKPLHVGPHTRLDPDTNDLYLINYDLEPPFLTYHRVNSEGNLVESAIIEKAYGTMMHDFVMTANYLIFFDCPAIFNLDAAEQGASVLQWRPELGSNIAIVARDDKNRPILWLKTKAFFVFHFANAYEEEDKIIVDYVRHSCLEFGVKSEEGGENNPPQMVRMEIDLQTKTLRELPLADYMAEFPTFNTHYTSKPYQFIYAPTRANNTDIFTFDALVKYDLPTKTTTIQDFSGQYQIGEAVFAPKPNAQAEDDGYLLLFAYDKKRNASDFLILNAKEIEKPPIAIIQLPRRVPHGLHGSWFPTPRID
ncbi:carotenoid oxygenase family protein [Legionella drozanskii]|uniref:Carotenoid cleavage oxygenase n=1 Tax=Legionella drozanskii LLAP-1 TaxID=1212489 RepID=A0A0W0SWW8_9GAMM|nr:carotenoid oxygenase family protein [Legionella drozanskii]KTC87816.1 Carotenoid cleavage oxygenase [Legionella drozanskii LLAP-1]